MHLTHANARRAALYGASLVLAAVVPALVRSLLRRASPAFSALENGSSVEPSSTSSGESDAIVSGIPKGHGAGILAAAVVGAAVGTGVALLMAPQSGKASREWIAGGPRALGARVGVASEEGKDAVPGGAIHS